ncbi:MAG: PAS domain S-box protein [Deltaproteobacteria bacterium]|nr:PAS domain S-box protein [Deltaproteobacteria bacterium]
MSGRVDDSDEGRSQAEPSEGSVEPGEGAWVERVIDRLGIGVFCVDNVQQRVTRANEAYARLFGFPSAAAASGTSVLEHYVDPKERLELATRLIASPTFRETGKARVEVRRLRIDNHEPVDLALTVAATFGNDGELLHMDCMAQGAGDRARVERAFRASEERFRTVFETNATGMALTDLDGNVVRANAAFTRFVGREGRELLGVDLFSMVYELDRPERPRPDAADASAFAATERRFVRPDGETVWGLVTWSWLSDEEGAPPHSAVVLVQDVTSRKRHEQEMLRIAKLESLGLLAGGIAHDFNNVLAVILASLSVVSRDVPAGSATSQLLETAEAATRRARDLARHLLTFARGGAPSRRVGSVAEIAREAAAFCTGAWPVAIDLTVSADAPLAEFDPVQISQVLHNLLINAVQAMPNGGRVQLGVERATLVPGSPVPLPPGDYVRVRVRDEGHGIAAEHVERIFDPYFSTRSSGTGLGLATVYSIVRRHGGHVGFESAPGRGATFDVYLPASRLPAPAVAPPSHPATVRRSARVLVMDDEPALRDVVAIILRGSGLEVDLVADGAAAVASYREALAEGRRYAAVLLDLTVPGGMGGLEAIRELRAVDPEVRAIVASGYAADPVLSNAREHGFMGSVVKPFTAEELDEVVSQVLSGATVG